MCGIAGVLDWTHPPRREVVQRMTDRLAHRGPDAEGVTVRCPLTLGHRRLSVIDLSPDARQPMSDLSGRYSIVFNGEIYNYRGLREELQSRGARFRTHSDTEVILEAYRIWNSGCVERLNGMFAFALWDDERQQLMLARDRLGEKPLFLQPLPDGGVVFASELKAIREHPAVSRRINPRALGQFLALNYVAGDQCILEGVEKLPPGHTLVIESGKPWRMRRYWDLAAAFRRKETFRREADAASKLVELLDDAVRLRLVSDVPLGAFLSGGCDSSAIVAAMCQLEAASSVRTFSIGFVEESYSELAEARFVASRLGVSHSERVVRAEMTPLLRSIVYHGDEPFADTSAIPVYFLAEHARRAVTVSLSGDGADEILAGYPTYQADRLRLATRWVPSPAVRALSRAVERWLPVSLRKVSLDYKLRQFLRGHPLDARRAHFSWRQIFDEEEQRALLQPSVAPEVLKVDPFAPFERHFEEVSDLHPLDQALYADTKTWLADDILVKLDRFSMAHSLEARLPFLDHRLVEFAAGLPPGWKLRGLRGKHLLKTSQAQRLPARTLRRGKQGFNAPVSEWLLGSMGELVEHASSSAMREWIRPEAVDRLREEHAGGERDHGLKLFGLTSLGLWMDQYL